MNCLILFLCLFCLPYAVFSQGIWKTYTTADGLAGNFVFCIAQDRLGNMWFGTWGGGASKLDSNGIFTNYLTDMYTVIYDIEIDTSNNKWMAIARGGSSFIVKFDDSTFTSYHPLGEPVINAPPNVLGQDSLGQIWCGVLNNSAFWFDGTSWNYHHVPGLVRAWDAVSEMKTDRHGTLYFSHTNGISTKTQYLLGLGQAADLAFDKQNRLWVAVADGKNGLWMYDGNNLFRWTQANGLLHPLSQVTDVAVDSNNNIWIANSSYWYDFYGVSKFDGFSFTHFNVADGLGHGFVYDIYVDKRGDIWFGTRDGGVSVLHDTTITNVEYILKPNPIIKTCELYQNYPNPFNSQTCFKYHLNVSGKIEFTIYNLLGKEVRTLTNTYQSAGEHEINWDGTDNSGKEVSSGIYLAVLRSLNFSQSIKISFIR